MNNSRTGSSYNGREQGVLIGRDKFGHRLGLNVCRQRADGEFEWLNLDAVGVPGSSLGYTTEKELDAVLEQLAITFEATIVPWLDGRQTTR